MEITTAEEHVDLPAQSGPCPCKNHDQPDITPQPVKQPETAAAAGPPPLNADDRNWYCWALTTDTELEPIAVVQWGTMREHLVPLQLEQLGLQLLRVAEQARHRAAIHRVIAVTGASNTDADEFCNAVAELRHEMMLDHIAAATTSVPALVPEVDSTELSDGA